MDLGDYSEMMRDAFANDSGLPTGHSRRSHRIKSTLYYAILSLKSACNPRPNSLNPKTHSPKP